MWTLGRHRDTSTGLYYLWHRYYDPGLRRFLTLDPAGGLVARPTSFNLYLYCYDNPLRYVDPSGLIARLEYVVVP